MPRKKKYKVEETVSRKKSARKNITSDEDFDLTNFSLANDNYIEEDLIGEIDEEDEEQEVMSHIREYEKEHKSKLVNIYKKIGKPKFKAVANFKDDKALKAEYEKFIILLDKHNIVVHFKNEYPVSEKYRFIIDEVFNQDVEDTQNTKIHINFVYEDFHPEMDFDGEDDDEFY
ncbi:MAG: hypothetical protein UZ04_CHB001000216 [Chlorobi bacterium OLB4]|jgi:hypothetical protein|nr:MAG: hypothetical protein UZ04_CHB001000216 [Chlorobi bacterium OLB4]MBW7854891.1 hypothetical protein [Ignavibacteria bacterium]OQY78472.1 MAG: hypothetical protein B6D43_03105 [Ignavibacteriales bacterium UTCHB1]